MKAKTLKNEDILFYAWTLTLFLFFSQTQCPTEVVLNQWNIPDVHWTMTDAYFQPWNEVKL